MQVSATGQKASSSVNNAQASFGNNFDSFLQLLTTQLKNQDPLSPLNATEFTTQLVQFSGVEQSIRQNRNLEALITLQKDSQYASAVGYLGKTIEAKGDKASLANGRADFNYTLDGPAAKTTLKIVNESGQVVRTIAGETTSGPHSFTWDGRNDSGVREADGTYRIVVTAADSNNQPVSATTKIVGKVTDVGMVNGTIVLTVGTSKIPLSEVTAVRETPAV
ncbi:MAG: flagellar hook assembly protein FlgD [Rhodospirillales bacterium]|nr:flagellar hook assembly protein FlgD [Rhodospirillales bacterium]